MDGEVDSFDSDSESELEDWVEVVFRKTYMVRERLDHMHMWTNGEFKTRFRLHCGNPVQQLLHSAFILAETFKAAFETINKF